MFCRVSWTHNLTGPDWMLFISCLSLFFSGMPQWCCQWRNLQRDLLSVLSTGRWVHVISTTVNKELCLLVPKSDKRPVAQIDKIVVSNYIWTRGIISWWMDTFYSIYFWMKCNDTYKKSVFYYEVTSCVWVPLKTRFLQVHYFFLNFLHSLSHSVLFHKIFHSRNENCRRHYRYPLILMAGPLWLLCDFST